METSSAGTRIPLIVQAQPLICKVLGGRSIKYAGVELFQIELYYL